MIPAKVPLNPAGYTVVPNAYASQDKVLLGQMVDRRPAQPGSGSRCSLGNDILGGNGFASRLTVDIRVKHGYAYGAGSGMSTFEPLALGVLCPDTAAIRARSGAGGCADPGRTSTAMQNTPVSRAELDNARQYEIRSIPVSVSSVERIARELLNWSWQGQPLDEPMIAARRYLDMTAQQRVQDALREVPETSLPTWCRSCRGRRRRSTGLSTAH